MLVFWSRRWHFRTCIKIIWQNFDFHKLLEYNVQLSTKVLQNRLFFERVHPSAATNSWHQYSELVVGNAKTASGSISSVNKPNNCNKKKLYSFYRGFDSRVLINKSFLYPFCSYFSYSSILIRDKLGGPDPKEGDPNSKR